jgi:hypothetical protein
VLNDTTSQSYVERCVAVHGEVAADVECYDRCRTCAADGECSTSIDGQVAVQGKGGCGCWGKGFYSRACDGEVVVGGNAIGKRVCAAFVLHRAAARLQKVTS